MTHQHTSNGKEWLMVEVPSDATDVALRMSHLDYSTQGGCTYESLPDGTWQIHSDSFTITEEQAGEIVNPIGVMYEDYEHPEDLFMTATLSYLSLLRSKQINSRVINLVRI